MHNAVSRTVKMWLRKVVTHSFHNPLDNWDSHIGFWTQGSQMVHSIFPQNNKLSDNINAISGELSCELFRILEIYFYFLVLVFSSEKRNGAIAESKNHLRTDAIR